MEKWIGKVAVVTGASSGIGAAIVRDLAIQGLIVIGLARRSENIEKIAQELPANCPGKLIARKCDIADYDSLISAIKWIEEKFSVVHILINNAGKLQNEKIFDLSEAATASINSLIDLNFKNLVHCTRECVRLMRKSGDFCFIINVASILGHSVPFPNFTNIYPATKYAVKAFSEILRQEMILENENKIKVSNLSPGIVETEIFHNLGVTDTKEYFEEKPPLRSDDISKAVLYLLSTPFNVNVTEIIIKPLGERF